MQIQCKAWIKSLHGFGSIPRLPAACNFSVVLWCKSTCSSYFGVQGCLMYVILIFSIFSCRRIVQGCGWLLTWCLGGRSTGWSIGLYELPVHAVVWCKEPSGFLEMPTSRKEILPSSFASIVNLMFKCCLLRQQGPSPLPKVKRPLTMTIFTVKITWKVILPWNKYANGKFTVFSHPRHDRLYPRQ